MRGNGEEREKCSGGKRRSRWNRERKTFSGISVLAWSVVHLVVMYLSAIYLVAILSAGEARAADSPVILQPDIQNGSWSAGLVRLPLPGIQAEFDSPPAGLAGFAEDQETGNLLGLEDFDFSDINSFLRESGETGLTMEEVMVHLAQGDLSGLCRKVMDSLKAALFAEVSVGGRLIGQVLALGLLGAVFTNFSTVFHNSEISETGFFITYLLLFTFLAASVIESMKIVAGTVGKIQEFMKLLMPSYFLAVAFAGGSVSAVVLYEFTLWIMAAGQWFLGSIALPAIKIYVLLNMAGNLVKEAFLSKLTELLGQAIGWGMKILPGLVLGFHVIQSMILPYVDSLKQGAVQKAVSMIPGVGQGAVAVTQLLVGSGVLIKNTMGMAAMVILMILIAMPVLKMLILMVMYQCVAAVMEPVCDKRFVSCVTAAARGQKMMVQAIIAAALILVITVAVVCAGTNVTYYA